ncbi:MAG: DUF393 domain-containing protein [Pseudomonadota bacterium]
MTSTDQIEGPSAAIQGASAAGDAARAVFYDGGCPVCLREVTMYQRMQGGGAIEWVDVTSAPDGLLPAEVDRATLMNRFTVRTRDGRLQDGAAGFIALWRSIERTRWLARLVDRWPLRHLAELGYRGFLLVRPLWRGRPERQMR